MSYNETLIYCYLIGKQRLVNMYNMCIAYLLGISKFEVMNQNKKNNLIYWFILYKFLTKIINFVDFIKNKLINVRRLTDIDAEKIHITKITMSGEKTIILDQYGIKIDDILNKLEILDINEKMMECIILNFELINSEENRICLKELLVKYNDCDKQFNHTVKNILDFNNIEYSDNSKLNIKVIKNKKIISEEKILKDIYNVHINALL